MYSLISVNYHLQRSVQGPFQTIGALGAYLCYEEALSSGQAAHQVFLAVSEACPVTHLWHCIAKVSKKTVSNPFTLNGMFSSPSSMAAPIPLAAISCCLLILPPMK